MMTEVAYNRNEYEVLAAASQTTGVALGLHIQKERHYQQSCLGWKLIQYHYMRLSLFKPIILNLPSLVAGVKAEENAIVNAGSHVGSIVNLGTKVLSIR